MLSPEICAGIDSLPQPTSLASTDKVISWFSSSMLHLRILFFWSAKTAILSTAAKSDRLSSVICRSNEGGINCRYAGYCPSKVRVVSRWSAHSNTTWPCSKCRVTGSVHCRITSILSTSRNALAGTVTSNSASVSSPSAFSLGVWTTANLWPSVAANSRQSGNTFKCTPASTCFASSGLVANKVPLSPSIKASGGNLRILPASIAGNSGNSSGPIPLTW